MSGPPPAENAKTLKLNQTWFLGVMAVGVILMFAFVILPYVDKSASGISTRAPDFDLELVSGGDPGDRIRLSDLAGRIVLIDFWASWCAPCKDQSRALSIAHSKLGQNVVVLGVATSDEKNEAAQFAQQEKLPFPNAFDEEGLVGRKYQVSSLPTLVLIDPAGRIRASESRVFTPPEILSLVASIEDK